MLTPILALCWTRGQVTICTHIPLYQAGKHSRNWALEGRITHRSFKSLQRRRSIFGSWSAWLFPDTWRWLNPLYRRLITRWPGTSVNLLKLLMMALQIMPLWMNWSFSVSLLRLSTSRHSTTALNFLCTWISPSGLSNLLRRCYYDRFMSTNFMTLRASWCFSSFSIFISLLPLLALAPWSYKVRIGRPIRLNAICAAILHCNN